MGGTSTLPPAHQLLPLLPGPSNRYFLVADVADLADDAAVAPAGAAAVDVAEASSFFERFFSTTF
ncbi:hypothetical protein [Thermogemmata fonticola]|jgi:hypothetical protein|uniref:hypothetical protein n=1 Tax=Thermogemmata fonticola TaxID=2755323 RepID=UPI001E631C5B|nr:hypothetical protein [Thermogemmata fonticola]